MFWCVSYYLGAIGTVWMPYKTRFKMSRSGEKVCATKSRRNFSQITNLIHPKGLQTHVLVCFALFGCIWYSLVAYNTRCKTGRSGAKVRAMKSFRNFSQRTHPIHPFGPLPHVLVHFVLFGCIWDSLLRYNTQFQTGQTGAKVRATMSRRNFSQRTHPIHPMGLETHVLVCF